MTWFFPIFLDFTTSTTINLLLSSKIVLHNLVSWSSFFFNKSQQINVQAMACLASRLVIIRNDTLYLLEILRKCWNFWQQVFSKNASVNNSSKCCVLAIALAFCVFLFTEAFNYFSQGLLDLSSQSLIEKDISTFQNKFSSQTKKPQSFLPPECKIFPLESY